MMRVLARELGDRHAFRLVQAGNPVIPGADPHPLAVRDAPQGPFRDSGKPLLIGGNGFEAIDPMAFSDPKSGRTFSYAGGSAGAKLRVFELNPDLLSFAREIPVETPRNFTDGLILPVVMTWEQPIRPLDP